MVNKNLPEGMQFLVKGYLEEYATEVLKNRAIPDIRDGLKPVHRRAVWAMALRKGNDMETSATAAGRVLAFHPHGDKAVYDAMVRGTDKSGYLTIPLFEAEGAMGHAYSTAKPADKRYTSMRLSKTAVDMAGERIGLEMKEGELDDQEPSALNARFPFILCGYASGIAVGTRTEIPPFNFWDVLDAVEHYVTEGDLSGVLLAPDYAIGGNYVLDKPQLTKIMVRGRGKIKTRAEFEVRGKEIHISEMPAGVTIEKAVDIIEKAGLQGVKSAHITQGYESSSLMCVTCKSKGVVDEVITDLMRLKVLQNESHALLLAMEGSEVIQGGVYYFIERWVKWRKKVVVRKYNELLESVNAEIDNLGYFIKLINNPEWRDTYLDKVINNTPAAGAAYLRELFDGIPEEVVKWIGTRRVAAFNKANEYQTRYEKLIAERNEYSGYVNDPESFILLDIKSLRNEYKGKFTRRTRITNVDYQFKRSEEVEEVDTLPCTFYVTADGENIVKTRHPATPQGVKWSWRGNGNDTLIGIDKDGRILRVYGEHLVAERRYHLAEYFDLPTCKPLHMGKMDGTTWMLLYNDGYVGFLDTSEWVGNNRRVKVIDNGVPSDVGEYLIDVIEETDIPEMLVVGDAYTMPGGNLNLKVAIVYTEDILRKGRKAKTRVFTGKDVHISYYAKVSMAQFIHMFQYGEGFENYLDSRLRKLGTGITVTDKGLDMFNDAVLVGE